MTTHTVEQTVRLESKAIDKAVLLVNVLVCTYLFSGYL